MPTLNPARELALWMRRKHHAKAYDAAMAAVVFCCALGQYGASNYYSAVAKEIADLESKEQQIADREI